MDEPSTRQRAPPSRHRKHRSPPVSPAIRAPLQLAGSDTSRPTLAPRAIAKADTAEVTLRRVISNAASVHRIIAAFDRLPIVQPGIGSCPEYGADQPAAQLVFRDKRAHDLAWSTQGAGAEIGRCNPMTFRLAGHKQPRLAEGLKLIALISRTLGVEVLHASG